ncbi:MAG: benzoylformate decarboxylase [Betaproteobacteria bacterium]|nr:benzoylformate decarboxylase [Betaproteobacteria bacterium]
MTNGEGSTVRDAVRSLMRAHGMTTVFGNPGSTELRFFRDWPQDFRYVLGLQESCVVAMADGYAQATGRAAFVNLHSAAGVGHALGSVFTACRNHAPLVITAGQQSRAMFPTDPYLFAQDAAQFPKPYVKWSTEPARAEDVPAAISRAYHVAMQRPRGPVFVSIPEDDWDATCEPVGIRHVADEIEPSAAALDELAHALAHAEAPALVVGASVDQDGAWELVVALAERLGAVVWASPMVGRCGFPEDHRLFAGHLPPLRQPLADRLAAHDVVFVIGAPVFTYHVHTGGRFVAPHVRLFLMTDDPDEAARAAVGTALAGSVRAGVAGLLARLGDGEPARQAGRGAVPPPVASAGLTGEYVMAAVARLMPGDAIVVEEAPTHRNALWDHLPIRRPGGFFAGASGGLGWAIAAAPGVALGAPGRTIVCIVGDGSALFGIQSLWTAAQWRLPITFVVLNNRGYAALRSFGRMLGIAGAPGHDLSGLDFSALSRGFGCDAVRVDRPDAFDTALSRGIASRAPNVIDVALAADAADLY